MCVCGGFIFLLLFLIWRHFLGGGFYLKAINWKWAVKFFLFVFFVCLVFFVQYVEFSWILEYLLYVSAVWLSLILYLPFEKAYSEQERVGLVSKGRICKTSLWVSHTVSGIVTAGDLFWQISVISCESTDSSSLFFHQSFLMNCVL